MYISGWCLPVCSETQSPVVFGFWLTVRRRSKDRENRQTGRPKRNRSIDLDLYMKRGKEIANICRSCREEEYDD
jgi:hypothetical protein